MANCRVFSLKNSPLFFLLTLFLGGINAPGALAAKDSPALLFFSGNLQGETAPCG